MKMKRKMFNKTAGVKSAHTGCQLSQPLYQRRFRYDGNVSDYVPSLKFPHNKTWNFLQIIQTYPVSTIHDYNMIRVFWTFFPLSIIYLHESYRRRYLPSSPSPLSSPLLSSLLSPSRFEVFLLLTVPLTINTPSRSTQHNLIFLLE